MANSSRDKSASLKITKKGHSQVSTVVSTLPIKFTITKSETLNNSYTVRIFYKESLCNLTIGVLTGGVYRTRTVESIAPLPRIQEPV